MTRWAASLAFTRGLVVDLCVFRKGALICDPDGHVLLIAEP